jgi:hypothetical protein
MTIARRRATRGLHHLASPGSVALGLAYVDCSAILSYDPVEDLRARIAILAGLLAAITAVGVIAVPASSRAKSIPTGLMTFNQAVAAGAVLSLAAQEKISGLPLCPVPNPAQGGYPTGAAANAAALAAPEAPVCMADPRLATYGASDAPIGATLPIAENGHVPSG